jgi:hypothetical protein
MSNATAKATAKAKLMSLLDQYAQEAGFANLQDLKNNYTDKAYAKVVGAMVLRSLEDEGFDHKTIITFRDFNEKFM